MTSRNKFLLIIFLFTVIPVLAVTIARFYGDSVHVKNLYSEKLGDVAATANAALSGIIGRTVEEVELQATGYSMRQYLDNPSQDNAELLRQNFVRFIDTIDLFDHFALVDQNGKIVLACHVEGIGLDASDMDYFRAFTDDSIKLDDENRPVVSSYVGRVHDSVTEPDNPDAKSITVSVCIRNADGDVRYVLVGFVNARRLGQTVSSVTFGETGVAFVIDSNNYIFNHPDPRFLNAYTTVPELANLIRNFESGEMPETGSVEYALDGVKRLYYYSVLPEYELAVILRQDLSEIKEAQNSDLKQSAAMALFVCALAFGAALILSERVSEPLMLIRNHIVHGKEDGDYETCDIKTTGELGEIIDGYNELVTRMSRQQNQIHAEREKNSQMSTHDQLTQLLNRSSFEKAFTGHLTANSSVGLILIKIADFKNVSDTYGHLIGDQVLIEAGYRMKSSAAKFEVCARIGSAQYMLCKVGTPSQVLAALKVLRREFSVTFDVDKTHLHLDINAGIAIYPQDGLLIDMLMSNADIALSKAREEEELYLFYTPKMRESINRVSAITEVLRSCVAKEEIFLMYQPIHKLSDGSIAGFESLMRIRSKRLGLVSPREFIPVAEKDSALIISIGNWTLRESCRFLRRMMDKKDFDGFISVNVFAAQLMDDNFVNAVLSAIKQAGIPSDRLRLEVTERIVTKHVEEYSPKLVELRSQGIKISLDDFGEVNSSLFFLSTLPLDAVKVDQTFFTNLNDEELITYMNRTIIDLGRHIGIEVSAERIENQTDLDRLKTVGYDTAQGYLFDYPLMEETALDLL